MSSFDQTTQVFTRYSPVLHVCIWFAKRRKHLNTPMKFMLMLVLTSSMSAVAQTDMSNDSSMKKDHMSGKKTMSMTGCIAEKDGKYMMTNQEHPDGVQLVSSEELKPHVGHQVKVTGIMESMSGDSAKSDDKMAGGDNMKHDTMAMMSMKVSSMKMISSHCGK